MKPGFVYTKMTAELKLPALLTAQPEQVTDVVYKGERKKKNTIYVKWSWRWIMLIIKCIPEFQFKKMKLSDAIAFFGLDGTITRSDTLLGNIRYQKGMAVLLGLFQSAAIYRGL